MRLREKAKTYSEVYEDAWNGNISQKWVRLEDAEEKLNQIRTPETLEKLAKLEHEQWSELIQYLIDFAPIKTLHGDPAAKEFWTKYHHLSLTPYSSLPEDKKESDRVFARKVLVVLEATLK